MKARLCDQCEKPIHGPPAFIVQVESDFIVRAEPLDFCSGACATLWIGAYEPNAAMPAFGPLRVNEEGST